MIMYLLHIPRIGHALAVNGGDERLPQRGRSDWAGAEACVPFARDRFESKSTHEHVQVTASAFVCSFLGWRRLSNDFFFCSFQGFFTWLLLLVSVVQDIFLIRVIESASEMPAMSTENSNLMPNAPRLGLTQQKSVMHAHMRQKNASQIEALASQSIHVESTLVVLVLKQKKRRLQSNSKIATKFQPISCSRLDD